jgi:hypothetical protein
MVLVLRDSKNLPESLKQKFNASVFSAIVFHDHPFQALIDENGFPLCVITDACL